MARKKHSDFSEINAIVEQRGRKVLEKFGQVAVADLSQPELLTVLGDVKAYWKDTYRPALTSLCCEAVGGQSEAADAVSLMITLASAGGGLHDDIIDKSLNKHFRMTILGLHGVDSALVVGDMLILKAWKMLGEVLRQPWQPKKVASIVGAFGSWTLEVCEAEFMETLCRRNLDTELEHYQKILWKSMADAEGCAKLGSIVGDGSEEEIQALAEFGRCLGYMFRLADDVKDALNIEGNLPARLEFESVPLPLLYSAKASKEYCLKIKSILENPPANASAISTLVNACFETGAFAYVYDLARQNARNAVLKLRLVEPSASRNWLSLMIRKPFADITELCT